MLALNSATQNPHSTLLAQNSAPNATPQATSQILLAQNELSDEALNSQNQVSNAQIPNTYQLGAVEITAPKEIDYNPSVATINAKDIKDSNSDNVAQALRMTPGVMINEAYGQRAEPAINIRGFGREQVGLYLDGIPVMEIYNRVTDYSQYITQGIASVQVSKGFTSPVYGINALGGAINLVSHRPQKELELHLRQKLIIGNHSSPDEIQQGVSVGTNQGKYYFQADVSHTNRSTYRVSSDFTSTVFQKAGGDQNNAYYQNTTAKLKVGFVPNENHEYSLNYIHQKGTKGGLMGENGGQFWLWPAYDKDTVYLLGTSFFTPDLSLNTRLYYDSFYNELEGYGNVNVNTGKPDRTTYIFNSIYDDDTYGGILTLSWDIARDSNLKFGANLKRDHHLESANDKSNLVELTSSIFAQFAQRLGDFRFVLAGSYDRADMISASYRSVVGLDAAGTTSIEEIAHDKTKLNGNFSVQGIVYYDLGDAHNIHISAGKKQNMPTLADRYSSRMGGVVQNPNLKVESALNYELGYDLSLASTRVSAAVFYNDMNNMFVQRDVIVTTNQNDALAVCAAPSVSSGVYSCSQNTNANEGYTLGGEIGVEQGFFADDLLIVGANYSYIYKKAKGLSDDNTAAGTNITNYPNHMFNASVKIRPIRMLEFIALSTLESARNYFDSSSQSYYKNNNFFTLDLSANVEFTKGLVASIGVMNVTDRDNTVYWHDKGNPTHLAGRRWFVGVDYKY